MAFDLSVPDKGRWQTLIADGRWHPLIIGGSAAHVVPPGDGWIQVDLFGDKGRGIATLWLRFQRYPAMDSTAWASFTLSGRAGWGVHHDEWMTLKDPERYGVDYRLEKGGPRVRVKNRVLKGDANLRHMT